MMYAKILCQSWCQLSTSLVLRSIILLVRSTFQRCATLGASTAVQPYQRRDTREMRQVFNTKKRSRGSRPVCCGGTMHVSSASTNNVTTRCHWATEVAAQFRVYYCPINYHTVLKFSKVYGVTDNTKKKYIEYDETHTTQLGKRDLSHCIV